MTNGSIITNVQMQLHSIRTNIYKPCRRSRPWLPQKSISFLQPRKKSNQMYKQIYKKNKIELFRNLVARTLYSENHFQRYFTPLFFQIKLLSFSVVFSSSLYYKKTNLVTNFSLSDYVVIFFVLSIHFSRNRYALKLNVSSWHVLYSQPFQVQLLRTNSIIIPNSHWGS